MLAVRHQRVGPYDSKYLLVAVHLGRSRVRVVAIDPADVESTAMGTALKEDPTGGVDAAAAATDEAGQAVLAAIAAKSAEELEADELARALAEAMGSDDESEDAGEAARVAAPAAEAHGGGDGHGHGEYVPEVEPRLQWVGTYESVAWLLGLAEVPRPPPSSLGDAAPMVGDETERAKAAQRALLLRMKAGLLRRLELVPADTHAAVVHAHVHADTAEPNVKTTPMLEGQLSAAEAQTAADGDKLVLRLDWLAPAEGVVVPASYIVRGGQDVTGDVPGVTVIDSPHRWEAQTRVHNVEFDREQAEWEAEWIRTQDAAALRRRRRQRWEATGPLEAATGEGAAALDGGVGTGGDGAAATMASAASGGVGVGVGEAKEGEADYDCSEEEPVRDSELSEDEAEWDMEAEAKTASRAQRRRRMRWQRWRARTPDERLRRVLLKSKDLGQALRVQKRRETARRHWIRQQRRRLAPTPIEELSRKVDREGMGKCDPVLPAGCNTAGHATAVFIRDVRLSSSNSVLVLMSAYLERALQPPLALVLNRNTAHPQHAVHSHKFIETDRAKINLAQGVWPSLVAALRTETNGWVPTTIMMLTAAAHPMDWGPAFGHAATGHRREWAQRDANGFRQRRDVRLLTPDGDVTSIFFGIRQPATLGSTPGVWPRRYAYVAHHFRPGRPRRAARCCARCCARCLASLRSRADAPARTPPRSMCRPHVLPPDAGTTRRTQSRCRARRSATRASCCSSRRTTRGRGRTTPSSLRCATKRTAKARRGARRSQSSRRARCSSTR